MDSIKFRFRKDSPLGRVQIINNRNVIDTGEFGKGKVLLLDKSVHEFLLEDKAYEMWGTISHKDKFCVFHPANSQFFAKGNIVTKVVEKPNYVIYPQNKGLYIQSLPSSIMNKFKLWYSIHKPKLIVKEGLTFIPSDVFDQFWIENYG